MKILVVPDSFKECLDAFSVAKAIATGVRRGAVGPVEVTCRPLADGGEGLLQVLLHALGGSLHTRQVTGPLGAPVEASLGLLDDGRTAVIEMAAAAGLHLVPQNQRNPLLTTTRGVGELLRFALDLDAQRIIVGLGGSATNDGGAGLAQALEVFFRDAAGRELDPGGGALTRLHTINISRLDSRIHEVEVIGACDVQNRLCGPEGAAAVFAPQKGATSDQVVQLDQALAHFAALAGAVTGVDLLNLPGGGAAGGLGAGLTAFAGARLQSGVELVFEAYGDMEAQVRAADAVISGEGAVDGQTLQGKVVAGVAGLAKRCGTPLFVLAGRVKGNLEALYEAGVTAVFPIAPEPMDPADAMRCAGEYLSRTAENLMRTLEAARGSASHE